MEPQKTQRALDLAAKERIIGVAYSASSPRFGLKIETKIGTEPVLHDISVRHLSSKVGYPCTWVRQGLPPSCSLV